MKKLITVSFSILCVLTSIYAQTIDTGLRLEHKGDYLGAEHIYKKLANQYYQEESYEDYAKVSLRIVSCELGRGQLDEAIIRSRKTLEFALDHLKKDSLLLSVSYMSLGNAYLSTGRNDFALEQLLNAEKLITKPSLQAAECYENIGVAYSNYGNKELALDYHNKAFKLRKDNESNSILIGDSNLNIGLVYLVEEPLQSLIYFNRALKSYGDTLDANHPKIALCYSNMAFANAELNNYDEALSYLDKVSLIWDQTIEGPHSNKAFVLSSRGRVYKMKEDYDKALLYQQEALEVYLKLHGDKHPDVANAYYLIGQVHQQKKDFKASLKFYQQAIYANLQDQSFESIYDEPKITGYFNPDILLYALQSKAKMLEAFHFEKTLKLRDIDGALAHFLLCDELITEIRQLRIDESDKLKLGVIAADVYENGISIAKYLSEMTLKKQYYLSLGFDFSEKSKAAVLIESINDSKAKHFSGVPDYEIVLEDSLKDEITYLEQMLINAEDEVRIEEIESQLFEYQSDLRSFIIRLEKEYPDYYKLKYDSNLASLEDIQNSLTDDQLILSYYIGKDNMYLFLISEKDTELIELDKSENFKKLIVGVRNALKYKAKADFTDASKELFKLLIPKLKGNQLYIIPDGLLSTLPFEVLLNDEGRYLIEDFSISYAYSNTLMFENVVKKDNERINVLLTAPVDFSANKYGLSNLPATATEVKEIKYLFSSDNSDVTLGLEERATESIFKDNLASKYDFIHFATHGLVDASSPSQSRIFLAPDDSNDGNLYCGEIYAMSLNAQLVTLSACETGLGKISKGEGVLGLSRALMYAGAENLVVSLWQVNDESTSNLMVSFYEKHLFNSSKEGFSDDLRKAKLELIKSDKYAFPYYWAPFVLIGK